MLNTNVFSNMNNEVKEVNRQQDNKESSIQTLENELEILKLQYVKSNKDFDLIKQKSSGIQKEFVAILGIFISILLSAFGGLNILQNILGNINEAPTGKLLVFSSLSIMGILLIVFLLLNGISKLTSLNLRSCICSAG